MRTETKKETDAAEGMMTATQAVDKDKSALLLTSSASNGSNGVKIGQQYQQQLSST